MPTPGPDLKIVVANQVKAAVRDHVVEALKASPGVTDVRIDTADNLKAHLTVRQTQGWSRTFVVKISEVM